MAAATIGFDGVLERIGDRTIVRLPADASAGLPSRGQVAVVGTIEGRALETVVEPDGRRGHWLAIDADLAAALGDGAVTVELTPTKAWPPSRKRKSSPSLPSTAWAHRSNWCVPLAARPNTNRPWASSSVSSTVPDQN